MNEGYDVILLGLSRWDNILNSSVLNIAFEWSKTNRVFYIDRPFSFKDYFLVREKEALRRSQALLFGKHKYERVKVGDGEIIAVTPKLSLPINFLPNGFAYDLLHNYNKALLTTAISGIISDFNVKDYLFFNSFIPEYFDVITPKMRQPLLKVYRSSDDISQEPYIAKHGVQKEKWAVKQADLVLVSSYGLQKKLGCIRNPIYRVPNAAQFSLFEAHGSWQKPKAMLAFEGKKTIFLSGNISSLRIDYPLLLTIAKHFKSCQLLIAGPVKREELAAYHLDSLENITWLGAMNLTAIANYLAYVDCAIIPFLKNTLTESIYPLKINEYLAAGKPVVSTNFSEDISSFASCIYLANNSEEFITNIEKALAEPKDLARIKQRKEVAKGNSWEHRMDEIKRLVELKIAEKQSNFERSLE